MRGLFVLFFVLVIGGLATASKSAVLAENKIVVVLGEQKVYALMPVKKQGRYIWSVAMTLKCSTGRKGLDTPIGQTKIGSKIRRGRALSELGGAVLEYQMRIPLFDPKQGRNRRIAFHAYSKVPSWPASSGCVRLKLADAKRLYDWSFAGTRVEVVQNRPGYISR